MAGRCAIARLWLVLFLLVSASPGVAAAESLAGQLLVATPTIGDPRFYHAVILMVRHDKDGAFGIVINRPLGERSLKSLLAAVGGKTDGVEGNVRVFAGGPVQPERGFVLHTTDYKNKATIAIDADLALTADREILQDIGRHKGPEKSLIAFGYAGWAAGQLDSEMGRHDWFIAPADPKLIFDEDRGRVWEEAMARRIREL
jgi:putative transcriptional regulator